MIWASASQSVAALQQGTQSVPIVLANVIDPVGAGFVASLARPAAIIDVYRHARARLLGRAGRPSPLQRRLDVATAHRLEFGRQQAPSPGRLSAAGWVTDTKAPWGRGHHQWFEKHFGRVIGVYAIGDDLPNPDNRVTLDPVACDKDGVPVARLHYAPGENDRRMMNFALDRLTDIARAAGAFEYRLTDYRDKDGVYRTPAWHMIGTCRMGDDPASSVVNKWNQSWDVSNLFIVDGSVLTTGGVVNPTPTISALALRAATYIRDNFSKLSAAARSAAA
jgi:choline dehydrogenase-like flavoprotein